MLNEITHASVMTKTGLNIPYASKIHLPCVLTTDIFCFRDEDAEAVLKLHAGFGPDYATEIKHLSCLEYILETIDLCQVFVKNWELTLLSYRLYSCLIH